MADAQSNEVRLALAEQTIKVLEAQNATINARLDVMQQTLISIDRQMNQAQGGWRVLLFLGTLMGGLTGVIGFFTGKITGAS